MKQACPSSASAIHRRVFPLKSLERLLRRRNRCMPEARWASARVHTRQPCQETAEMLRRGTSARVEIRSENQAALLHDPGPAKISSNGLTKEALRARVPRSNDSIERFAEDNVPGL